jgi:hypothetical protein
MLFHNLKRWTLLGAFQTTTNNKQIKQYKLSMEANVFIAQPNPVGCDENFLSETLPIKGGINQ